MRLRDYPAKYAECLNLGISGLALRIFGKIGTDIDLSDLELDLEKFADGIGNPLRMYTIVPKVLGGYSGIHTSLSGPGIETVAHFVLALPDETLTGREARPYVNPNLREFTRVALANLLYLAENEDARYPAFLLS